MPILPVSRSTFDQLHPNRPNLPMQEEIEWLAERSRLLIGYVARDLGAARDAAEWLMAIEGRDEHGKFHVVDSREHLGSQPEARAILEKRMNELLATGLKVFPRGVALPR
jgi:hypothetical protein